MSDIAPGATYMFLAYILAGALYHFYFARIRKAERKLDAERSER